MKNCFTYAPLVGVIDGIGLSASLPTQDGGVLSPRVTVGVGFVQLDRQQPAPMGDGNIVTSARLKLVNPLKGRAFYTLARRDNACVSMLCLIDLNLIPKGMRLKRDREMINAWVTFETEGNPNIVLRDAGHGRAFVEFTADHQAVLVFDRDGLVYRLGRQGNCLLADSLSPREMARERVRVLRQMLDNLSNVDRTIDPKVRGIIGGAIRLLDQALGYPEAADVLVDFLIEFIGDGLTDTMRKQVRGMLYSVGHRHAVMFADGYGSTVVSMNSVRTGESNARALAERKRKERSDRDRDLRSKMRGGTGGGGKKKNRSA